MSYAGGSPVVVDDRVGSADLYPMLQSLGIPSRKQRLEYGDVEWVGRGPEGRPVAIGAEIKAVGDLIQVFLDGRMTGTRTDGSKGQIPGLVERNEVSYLVVEGMRMLPGGLVSKHSGVTYDKLVQFLTSVEENFPVTVVYVNDRRETAAWISAKYRWWNGKDYEQHRSHLREHRRHFDVDPISAAADPRRTRRVKVALSLADGMGAVRAGAAADSFKSVREMVNASPARWQEVDGIGKKMAHFIDGEVS